MVLERIGAEVPWSATEGKVEEALKKGWRRHWAERTLGAESKQ